VEAAASGRMRCTEALEVPTEHQASGLRKYLRRSGGSGNGGSGLWPHADRTSGLRPAKILTAIRQNIQEQFTQPAEPAPQQPKATTPSNPPQPNRLLRTSRHTQSTSMTPRRIRNIRLFWMDQGLHFAYKTQCLTVHVRDTMNLEDIIRTDPHTIILALTPIKIHNRL
jgi:hypothetical protein